MRNRRSRVIDKHHIDFRRIASASLRKARSLEDLSDIAVLRFASWLSANSVVSSALVRLMSSVVFLVSTTVCPPSRLHA